MSTRTGSRHVAPPEGGALNGTGRLLRLRLRFSRRSLFWWTLLSLVVPWYTVTALGVVFDEPGALEARAQVIGLPAGAMLTGPGYGLEAYTLPALMANELLGAYAVCIAILTLRLAIRHTRAEEEAGRADLLRALPLARLAPLTAALLTVLIGAALVSAAVGVGLLVAGFDLWSTVLFAAGLLGVGLVFGCVGALYAQLSATTRTASTLAALSLVGVYLLRAAGDVRERGGSMLSWLSPIGWAQQTRAYVDPRPWPLLLFPLLVLLLLTLTYVLQVRREVDAGLLPPRAGPARLHRWQRNTWGMTWRLERGRLLIWAFAVFLGAVINGSFAGPIADAFRDIPQLQSIIGVQGDAALDELVLGAMSLFLALMAMVIAIFAVQAPHRLRQDEALGRAGLLAAYPVSRQRIVGSQFAVVLVGVVLLSLLSGLGMGLGAQSAFSESMLGTCVGAALAYVPLIACWLALALLAYGWGHGGMLVWLLLVGCIVIGMYGALLNVPQAVRDLEPFTALDAVGLVREAEPAPILWGYGLAVLVLAAGAFLGFRRRNLLG